MSNLKVLCECGEMYNKSYDKRHIASKVHQAYIEKTSDTLENNNSDSDDEVVDDDEIIDNNFLDELNNQNYIIEDEPIIEKIQPVYKMKKTKKQIIHYDEIDEDDDIFSNTPTPILGEQKHILLSKIKQYKLLFKEELKKFKIKKNPTVEELQAGIDEMDVIISTNSVDSFITEGILQSLSILEGASTYTNFNISGLANLLKNNTQFHNLTKQLYLKYKVFSNVPPESQLLFLVSTTAYICIQKNKSKSLISSYLNEQI